MNARDFADAIGPVLAEQLRKRDQQITALTMRLLALEQRLDEQLPLPPADPDDDEFVQGEAR